jgi:protoporphyrinogen IX oxidase
MSAVLPWFKALHIISVIAWMAGMLYLPRLFVYHADTPAGSPQSETFKVMERRLYRIILTPAMLATWMFGGLMLSIPGAIDWHMGYMYAKLALVLIMTGLHGYFAMLMKAFAADRNTHTARFYRMLNEAPTVLLVLIVILIVVRPF